MERPAFIYASSAHRRDRRWSRRKRPWRRLIGGRARAPRRGYTPARSTDTVR